MIRLARQGSIVAIIVLVALVVAYLYSFLIQGGDHPFFLGGSKTLAESAAAKLEGTTQVDNITLVNVSERPVKLWHVQFVGYRGVRVSTWRVDGEPLHGQEVPPNDGDGITFNVYIASPTIHDPKSILVTYSYWGIKHTQRMNLGLPN